MRACCTWGCSSVEVPESGIAVREVPKAVSSSAEVCSAGALQQAFEVTCIEEPLLHSRMCESTSLWHAVRLSAQWQTISTHYMLCSRKQGR